MLFSEFIPLILGRMSAQRAARSFQTALRPDYLRLGYDSTNGALEYNIVVPSGPNTNHTAALETTVDKECPQSEEFT